MSEEQDIARQYMYFEGLAIRKWGWEFQHFFERLVEKVEDGFVPVRPIGKEGDWKCDGYSYRTGRFFQVYAPRSYKIQEAIKKAKEDFENLFDKWPTDVAPLSEWVFVYGHHDMYPSVRTEMIRLAKEKKFPLLNERTKEHRTRTKRDGTKRRKFCVTGYEATSSGPKVILSHPNLPSLDFGDAVRS